MFVTKKSLSRRTFLHGAGATLALPLLEAMVPAFTATAKSVALPVRRFAGLYVPHGMIMEQFTPAQGGTGFDFTPILKSLEPFRESLVVVTGANGPLNRDNGAHAYAPSSWLTGAKAKKTQGSDMRLGVSLDQVLARHVGQDTPLPSLELATEDFTSYVGTCEAGFSCTYMNTLSWSSPTTPLPMEINPRVVFERLYAGTGTLEQRTERIRRHRSILDVLMHKATQLQKGLGPQDRTRLDEYLENIREIERRIQRAEARIDWDVTVPPIPSGIPTERAEHVEVLFDLLAAAWQADLTRVASFMIGRDHSLHTYPEIGVSDGHHPLSHHGNNPKSVAKFAAVNAYETQFFSKFLARLDATPDGEGSLLDHAIILFGSGMSGGNSHDMNGLPILVAGGGVGRVKGGRHLKHPVGPAPIGFPLGNVLLTIGQKMGVEMSAHGESTGTIDL
jgi:Protein of unknown function (DUF1552)